MKWQPGTSGNPGGRPKGYGDLRELARTHTEEAVNVLVTVMRDESAAPTARTSAAQALLDCGWGRPEQTVVEQKKEPGLVALLQEMQTRRTEEETVTPGGHQAAGGVAFREPDAFQLPRRSGG